MPDQTPYYLAFSHMLGIGPVNFDLLLRRFETPKQAWKATSTDLQTILGPALTGKFLTFRSNFDPRKKLQEVTAKKIQTLTPTDPRYPLALKHIIDPPICLYLMGDPDLFTKHEFLLGVVGTRRATTYGIEVTQHFVTTLAAYGVVIVSGMAIGIDAVAHRSALEAGGTTLAVLGCGVDLVYPRENTKLYHEIIQKGAVVSEFPPGMTTLPGLFVARNRIVSGVGRGVLIIEGAKQSGTLITARYAAEQGRDVFAPPSPITSIYSEAPNMLIKNGAILTTTPQDILEHYQLSFSTKDHEKLAHDLSPFNQKLFEALLREPQSPDSLGDVLKAEVGTILSALTELEIEGIINKQNDGKYYIKKS